MSPKYPELTPYQFASNIPIQAIDLDGLEAVSYQIEARGRYGVGILSVATSQTVGVAVDFNGNLAGFYTPTLVVGAGEGFVISQSFTLFKNANSVEDIKGMGFNAGAFYAVPGVKTLVGGGEINLALRDDLSINKVGGTVSGSIIPGPKFGIGIGGYLEGSYTFMSDIINVEDFEGSNIFNELVIDFGFDGTHLKNVVEDIYEKAKNLNEQEQHGDSKGLNELLRDRNITPMDATMMGQGNQIDQKSDDR